MFSQISLVASDFFCATSNLYKCECYSTSVTMMLIILSNPTCVSCYDKDLQTDFIYLLGVLILES